MSPLLIVRDHRSQLIALRSDTPPAIEWVNAQETYHRMDEIDGEFDPDVAARLRPAFYLAHTPPPELRIDDPDFDLDMFFIGLWIVSARMREALALRDDEAIYRDASVTGAPGPARLGYAAVGPIHHLDGIDPERSDIEEISERTSPHYYWELASSELTKPRVALRPGLRAPAPLFYMDRTDWLMITEEAAQRVRTADITNIFFDEPGPIYGSWRSGPF
ncbi:imm11 family protein [Sphingomonas sp.]|uniref:imm11 family protein n=1 Tax=Sphingomonas sp. TaxID=28214 RepID=UPI003AFFD193